MPEVLEYTTTPIPSLLVELPSRRQIFFANLRDFLFPRQLPPLDLRSAPAPFWHDVFVERGLPWIAFLKSTGCHIAALTLMVVIVRFLAMRPHVVAQAPSSQILVYQTDAYLPPLDTRREEPTRPAKADPEFSPQPIISVPREADNRSQTIVTPPNVRLNHDVPLPNIVAWSDQPTKPQLYIQPAPTLAAEVTRLAPKIEDSVVAPPPELQTSASTNTLRGPPPAVIAPPPSVENTSRQLGQVNIGRSAVIAPAPQLSVAEQSAFSGARPGRANVGPQVVPPPPSVSAGSPASGSRGRIIALNLHPAVGAPPAAPAGNRRGNFAATPDGHTGASGSSGASSGAGGSANGAGSNAKASGDLPSGLYVGKTAAKISSVASQSSNASAASPSRTSSSRAESSSAQPNQAAKASNLTDAERQVFGDRKVYSVTLNMPNLNSAGGSWVVRFAEMKPDGNPAQLAATTSVPTTDLSQPSATRKVDPAYPMELMRENIAGTVILYGIIRKDGTVANIRVIRSVDSRLDRFASQALSQWQFQPAMKNDSPVDVEATFQIPFRPSRNGF
jgi:TonB family protein